MFKYKLPDLKSSFEVYLEIIPSDLDFAMRIILRDMSQFLPTTLIISLLYWFWLVPRNFLSI